MGTQTVHKEAPAIKKKYSVTEREPGKRNHFPDNL